MNNDFEHQDTGTRERYDQIFMRYREFTMVARDAYIANLTLVGNALASPRLTRGCIIECGTWRGGMAAGLMTVGGPRRVYHFFDSFKGLPRAEAEDGEEARRWQEDRNGPRYFNNCTASLEEFTKVITLTGVPSRQVHVHAGLFEETFASTTVQPISVLRLDADWYKSTMSCFEKFWDVLLPGAVVLIDDYYDWEGCRKAVHAFLASRSVGEALRQTCPGGVCYILKG